MARKLSPERREKFLDAALKLFVQNGVQNTSTAAIAREADSAAGTLFIYFKTKQDLIDELVLNISREQSESIKALIDPARSARETFYAIWTGSIRWFIDHPDAYAYIRQIRDSGAISKEIIEQTAVDLAYYFTAIQKGVDEGSVKPYPPDLVGTILYQDIVAVMSLINNESDPAKQKAIIETGFEIFWNGIRS
jgi:AcrR family transcriptional regulator